VAGFFDNEQKHILELQAVADEASRMVEEYVEEHAVDEGLLAEAMEDGKVTKTLATARLKEAKRESSDLDEVKALEHVVGLFENEATAKKAAKQGRAKLDLATLKKYGELTEAEVKTLVVSDKWGATVASRISGELTSLVLALAARLQELGERYGDTVGGLETQLAALDGRVAKHLAQMGIK
jgi:type I restriction enzyme M protein